MQASATDILQPLYTDPLHYVAMPGVRFGRRAAALILDWLILFFVVPGIAILAVAVNRVLPLPARWENIGFAVVASVLVIAAYTLCYGLGATPGMLVAQSRVIHTKDGEHIGWGRAFLRGLSSFVFIAAWFWVFSVFIFSDARVEGSSTMETVIDYTGLGVFAVSLAGRLWMLGERHRQTLFDQLLSVKVIAQRQQTSSEA